MSEVDNLYIGFDLSTQQLKLTAIGDTHKIVFEETVHFDKELQHYGYIIIRRSCQSRRPFLIFLKKTGLVME